MTFVSNCKEDLQYHMADILQQLAQSEEERKKLQKTCNMLMTAFREEEKLHYKALENKYEKFVEDCKVRRRRNDMILRSIHRVEDRARALFTKTERLKILKNRYMNFLKPLKFEKNETFHAPEKTFTSAACKSTTLDKEPPKFVHWKTPSVADFLVYPRNRRSPNVNVSKYLRYEVLDEPDTFLPSQNYYDSFTRENKPFNSSGIGKKGFVPDDKENNKEKTRTDFSENIPNDKQSVLPSNIQNEMIFRDDFSNNEIVQGNSGSDQFNRFKRDSSSRSPKINAYKENVSSSKTGEGKLDLDWKLDSVEAACELREKSVMKHQESIEKLKTALSIEEDIDDQQNILEKNQGQQIIEKDEIENNEKGIKNKADVNGSLKSFKENLNCKNSPTSSPKARSSVPEYPIETPEQKQIHKELPKGLDGIDYENETYPESYYEQPVRQNNYSSISSNVILEEDEQEIDQQEVMETPATPFNHPQIDIHSNEKDILITNHSPQSKNSSDHSLKSELTGESPRVKASAHPEHHSEGTPYFSSDKHLPGKTPVETKTTLKHLLESDSESFQIEHGDVTSVNEDSDFDFSFNQN